MKGHAKWLFVALALFGLAAWLMSHGEKGGASAEIKERRPFPERLDREGWQRVQRRLTLPSPAASHGPPERGFPRMRDPLLTALSPTAKINLVFEASAIRDSPLGQMLVRCLNREAGHPRDREAKMMLDFFQQVDRVAFSDDVVLATGGFDLARWRDMYSEHAPSPYGEATIYQGHEGDPALATRAPNLVLFGQNRGALERAIDRIDHPDPETKPPIAPSDTYGEIYGVLDSKALTKLLPDELRDKFADATNRIELHADTRDDVLIVADVGGAEATRVEELGRALAGAMAVGRVKARAESDAVLQQLLERSRVSLDGKTFRVEAAFPLALIANRLGDCAAVDGGP